MWTENFQIYKLDLEKAEEPDCQHLLDHGESKGIPKNIYFCFIDYTKAFDCVDHSKLWNILKEMAVSDHLRNVYAGQKAIVRTADCFIIGKGVQQEYILSPCLFNFYAEYTTQTAKLDE